jgi:hypothetical protein
MTRLQNPEVFPILAHKLKYCVARCEWNQTPLFISSFISATRRSTTWDAGRENSKPKEHLLMIRLRSLFTGSLVLFMVVAGAGCSEESAPEAVATESPVQVARSNEEPDTEATPSTQALSDATDDVAEFLFDRDLSEEEQAERGRQLAANWFREYQKYVDAHDQAPEEKKRQVLDAYIDAELASRKQWEAEWSKLKTSGMTDEEIARKKMAMFVGKDASERKERSEARDPDQAAKQSAFYNAMIKRAKERGVDLRHGRRG